MKTKLKKAASTVKHLKADLFTGKLHRKKKSRCAIAARGKPKAAIAHRVAIHGATSLPFRWATLAACLNFPDSGEKISAITFSQGQRLIPTGDEAEHAGCTNTTTYDTGGRARPSEHDAAPIARKSIAITMHEPARNN
jgi:hypothetical protein